MDLRTFVDAAVALTPDKPFLFFEDQVFSYAQLGQLIRRAGQAVAATGAGRGTNVATLLPSCPEMLITWLGIASAGATVMPINPRSRPAEIAGLLAHSEAASIVTDETGLPTVTEALNGLDRTVQVLRVDELQSASDAPLPEASRPTGDDVAALLPTSGTTGLPKLVMQTHRAFVLAGEGFPWWMGLRADDRLMTSLPLFHLNAVTYSTLGALAAGASLALLPRFSVSQFWDQARRYQATEFNAIGAMLEMLLRQPERPSDREHQLRVCYSAPAPSAERHQLFERRFGVRLVIGYGLSESTYGLITPLDQPPRYGSMGLPRQHPRLGHINDVKVVDEQGAAVPLGQAGEILVRNPATMRGYYRMAEQTSAVLRDGWLHTGDLVRQDDEGAFYFIGRKKEVIRRRGENLAPAEVEEALASHPDVVESAVVGVPSPLTEEDVKAFVILQPGRSTDPEALRAWCAERLAPFKIPRYIEYVASLPRTPTERVAKHQLPRDRTSAEYDAETALGGPAARSAGRGR